MMDATSLSEIKGRQADVADYSVHGIVGIRLVNAAPADIAAVTRHLGAIRAPLEREPDITVRFVERLRRPPRLIQIGLDDAGFTDAGFFPPFAQPATTKATIERDLISDVLSAVPAHVVRHPFPAHIPTLFKAMEPVVVGV